MLNVFIADGHKEERSAFRLLLSDLKMQVVGEAVDWVTTLTQAPSIAPGILLITWAILPHNPSLALLELRLSCPSLVIILISDLGIQQQTVLASGADHIISKGEMPERVVERIKDAARLCDHNLH